MKTILVPTDFSKCSYNAARYATAIAKATKAKIILLHVYQNPLMIRDLLLEEQLENAPQMEALKRLKKITRFELVINDDTPDLEIKYEATEGLTVDEILFSALTHDVEMIVMGTQGASNLKEIIMGSNTANVIAKSTVPVLAVPQSAKYLGLNKIVFATDFHEVKNNSSLDSLLEITLLFDSEILIYSVLKNESDMPTAEQTSEYFNLDKLFERIPHSIHTEVSDDIPEAINTFSKSNYADLLVTIPQKHNFLELLFNKSITRNLVFHTQLPLLCLPDKN